MISVIVWFIRTVDDRFYSHIITKIQGISNKRWDPQGPNISWYSLNFHIGTRIFKSIEILSFSSGTTDTTVYFAYNMVGFFFLSRIQQKVFRALFLRRLLRLTNFGYNKKENWVPWRFVISVIYCTWSQTFCEVILISSSSFTRTEETVISNSFIIMQRITQRKKKRTFKKKDNYNTVYY